MPWPFSRRRPPRPLHARVTPWLYVGPALDEAGYRRLRDAGVTHVVDLRSEGSDDPQVMRQLGLEWARVPIDDRAAPTDQQVAEINGWLEASADPPVVYIHCEGGLGRSPTVAIALLMQRGFSRAEAHRFMLTARSIAAPTPAQEAWLSAFEETLAR